MRAGHPRSLCCALRLPKVQWTIRACGCKPKTDQESFRKVQINTGDLSVCGLQRAGERRPRLDFIRAEPTTTQRPVAYSNCCVFEIGVPNASTVVKERLKDPREFVWHVPDIGGSQPNGGFEKERAASSLPVCHSSLSGVP